MSQMYRVALHNSYQVVNGAPVAVLWPDHKPVDEVLDLQDTTPETVWEGTYQGNPTPPGGNIFKRAWWEVEGSRFDHGDRSLANWVVGRWISWDTGIKDTEESAYTSMTVGELWPDYRMAIRQVWRERLEFPALPAEIVATANKYNRDHKLRGIIIEDKATGPTAIQTIRASAANSGIAHLLIAWPATVDKITRAKQAAVWCKNGSVLLPQPGQTCPWLMDFEDELFDFPGSAYMDQVDSFSQLIIYTENLLAEGWKARGGAPK